LVSWAAPVHLGTRGAPAAAVWVLEDRSALQQAEAARQDSQGRLRAVVDAMAEGLLVQDRDGAVVEANRAACALFGAPCEQLLGRSLFELNWAFLGEDGAPLPRDQHPTRAVLRTGRPVRNLVVGLAREGDPAPPARWLLVNALPLGVGLGSAPAAGGEPA